MAVQFGQGSGTQQTGQISQVQVGGHPGAMVVLQGRSPVASRGNQVVERDVLVTVVRPDGDLSFITFVAPQQDYAKLQRVFDRMIASFSPQ